MNAAWRDTMMSLSGEASQSSLAPTSSISSSISDNRVTATFNPTQSRLAPTSSISSSNPVSAIFVESAVTFETESRAAPHSHRRTGPGDDESLVASRKRRFSAIVQDEKALTVMQMDSSGVRNAAAATSARNALANDIYDCIQRHQTAARTGRASALLATFSPASVSPDVKQKAEVARAVNESVDKLMDEVKRVMEANGHTVSEL
jgi:hypothetical protein